VPRFLNKFLALLLGGQIIIGPLLISTGGRGIALIIFLFFVNLFNLSKFIVEIKLIIFLFFGNSNFGIILIPTLGVKAKIIVDDLLIIY
tara:strand:+ start:505 stop:771 length:267 start_codon:yes stop_codon:yes gene_type:complete